MAGFCLSSTFVLGTAPPAVSIGQRLTCIIMRGYLKGQLGELLVHSVLYMMTERKSMTFECLLPIHVLPGGSFVVPNCCSNEPGPAKSAGSGGGT